MNEDGSETSAIRRLDERTVQRIAAGEVVERPASIVKELVENALDADASRIAVSVTGGGTERIRVRDDGVGIPPDQLPEAVAEHATSKIGDIADLESGVGTLGFRGEALYTIGAVSRLTIRSRPRPEAYVDSNGDSSVDVDADSGAAITVEGGEVGEVRPAGCPVGTTVEVEDVFYNTPAREKFLKTDATEFDHVNRVLTQYALANPDVAVSLEHDGRETFATEGNGNLESAVLAVYGRDVATSMRQVEWRPTEAGTKEAATRTGMESGAVEEDTNASGSDDGDPVHRVHGLVSHPETTRASREYLSTFVNGRYVRSSALRNAVVDAYGGQLAADRYPFAVLFVEVPPETVDVNVHPRKTEVRFDAESAVRDAVETAVERALLDHGLVRSGAPRGRSAPEETPIEPERPGTEVRGGAGANDGVGSIEGTGSNGHAGSIDPVDRDATSDGEDHGATGESERADATIELDPDDEDAWLVEGLSEPETSVDVGTESTDGMEDERSSEGEEEGMDEVGKPEADETATHHARASSEDANASPSPRTWQREESDSNADETRDRTRSYVRPNEQETLDGETTAETERAFDSLPRLRVLGQLHGTYVVAETGEGLVLIDQHAADERVNYERLQAVFADGMDAQALAEPVTVELTAREAALLGEFEGALCEIGFRTERSDDREVVVSAVPAVFDATLDPELLRDVLGSLVEEEADDAEPVEDVVDELLSDLACYPSITGNTSLTEGSVVGLLDALDDCENPWSCPHGRPVVIRIDAAEIDERFERDYPGH